MVKYGWIVVFMFLFIFQVGAQTAKKIKVDVQKTSLSRVLFDLRESYGIQFAFDSDILSKYSVSLNRTFQSEDEALKYLLKNLPFELEKNGGVFIIIPVAEGESELAEPVLTKISGQVLEAQSYEPLPFSYIIINEKLIESDRQGNFDFIASADSTFNLQISHLGYFIYDTTFTSSVNQKFILSPELERISEIRVESSLVEKSTLIGDKAGRIKLNHRIAPVLPGHGDNSVFNLLRLMPGVLAAGEQSNDLLIWGAYESHSKIQFDGFTVFGLKNFNDNISVVNPFMVKNIEVMKGGYEARYGDRVGGIVDITGKNGTLQKPTFTFNINTTTVNSLLEIPLSKKSSVLAAYRQTYYQLYDPTELSLFRRKGDGESGKGGGNQQQPGGPQEGPIDFNVQPNFVFRDANLKYVQRNDNGGQFSLSLYGGGDKFDYSLDGGVFNTQLKRSEEEKNNQFGSSLQFSQPWKNGNSTKLTAAYSVFERTAEEKNENENIRMGTHQITKNVVSENNVDELALNAEHKIPLIKGHNLTFGLGAINNKVQLSRRSFNDKIIDLNTQSPRLVSYVQDELPIGKFMELKSGLRVIYSTELQKWFTEPRISASIRLTESMKFNASWGLYNQFMAKTSVVDSSYNYSYFWTNSDGDAIPVLSAQHWVAGFSVNKNGFTFSTEAYHKTTAGLTRFFNGSRQLTQGFYEGDAKSYGLDFYIKKEFKKHVAWASYTLSKTEEHFPFYFKDYYKLAPHHQTHELKLAGIFNYKSFYLSTNYVYGSGFERYNFETEEGLKLNQNYNRLDAALVYKFKPGKIKTELGLSVLNVLDTDNIKYSTLRRSTVDEINLVGIYGEAVPFTPTLFLKLQF